MAEADLGVGEPGAGEDRAGLVRMSGWGRQNLLMRMGMRGFTGLTNGFSKRSRTRPMRWGCTTCTTPSLGPTGGSPSATAAKVAVPNAPVTAWNLLSINRVVVALVGRLSAPCSTSAI